MTEGDASGRIFTFPIPTYNIGKDFDWNDDRFDPIWEMTAKYGIPYFANFVNSDMDPDDARSMCCRLRLDNRELHKRGGGLFGANPLTGSIGVVTINMPRLGYLAKNQKEFYKKLDELMDIAKGSLETKRKLVEGLTEQGLYPYTKFYLDAIKLRRGQYWANHFSTIGLVGMNEAMMNLIGKDVTTKEGQKLAEEILVHMRERIIGYQEETGNLYNLEATPAEGTSYRLARIDKAKYPKIIFANDDSVKQDDSEPYYTNSSQLPVQFTEDIFEALDLQENLQTKYTGGTVLHGFLGERIWDIQMVKKLVRKIAESYSLPYFTLSPTFSICPVHGYLAGEQPICPKCVVKQETEVYSRVVGYIRPVKQWNKGKQAEFKDRKEFAFNASENKK
jgi:ribonucleoside-triphosphate reductase (formate)